MLKNNDKDINKLTSDLSKVVDSKLIDILDTNLNDIFNINYSSSAKIKGGDGDDTFYLKENLKNLDINGNSGTNIINGKTENTKQVSGTFLINSNNPKHCISVLDDEKNVVASLGVGGINSNVITCFDFACGNGKNTENRVNINGSTGSISASGTIKCNSLTQTSLEKNKKNFEKYSGALDEVKNIDIYKYNFIIHTKNKAACIGVESDISIQSAMCRPRCGIM